MARALKFDLVSGRLGTVELPAVTVLLWSSRPYPVELAADALMSGAQLVGGSMFTGLLDARYDSLASSCVLGGGSLRALQQAYVMATEALATNAALAGGELRTLQRTYGNYAPEAVVITAAVSGGELRALLLAYTNWPAEATATTATLAGGSLGAS